MLLSRVQLFATLWTVAYQAPPSMGFSRQEYWSGLPFPSPGDLTSPGFKPGSPALHTDTLLSEPPGKSKCLFIIYLATSTMITWRRQWPPTPVLLLGKFHGWRSLVGYSPQGCKESDMTEHLHFHFFTFTFIMVIPIPREYYKMKLELPSVSQFSHSVVSSPL